MSDLSKQFQDDPQFRALVNQLFKMLEGHGNTAEPPSPELSLVLPIFNEEENIPELHRRISAALASMGIENYEAIFVNDGSSDHSEELIRSLADDDKRVRLINFSRNFGHQAAITAGMEASRGNAVILMDSDLQDPPEVLSEMVAAWKEGNEVVYAVRKKRKEPAMKRLMYYSFYRLLRLIADIKIPLDSGDFCLMDRRVVDQINALPERNRFVRGLRSWVGFRQTSLPYERQSRFSGEPKYDLKKLVKLAVGGILSFSSFPLRLATYLGFITVGAGILAIAVIVAGYFVSGQFPQGWASLMAVFLFVAGVQLLVIGAIGEYVALINDEIKHRPIYIIRDTKN